tara:strand:+ start:92 stop:463 length:372 start_codon:yes stop_codon:yes gene_type:complete
MLCTNYEEALDIYERYSENIIGVITDAGFPRNGEHDNRAGMHPSTRAIFRLQPCMPARRVPNLQPQVRPACNPRCTQPATLCAPGIRLAEHILADRPSCPVLVQSADADLQTTAEQCAAQLQP